MILVSRLKTFTPVIRMYKGVCYNAVLELIKPMLDKGHTLYFGTWYSCPKLYAKLCMTKKNFFQDCNKYYENNAHRFTKEKVEER